MKTLITIILIGIAATGCQYNVKFPDGGYAYPANLSQIDTNHLFLNAPGFQKGSDSFYASYYGRYWCKAYNEPNLSLRPLKNPVFRLAYHTAFGHEIILTLTPTEIIAKELTRGSPYPLFDTLKLTTKERFLYSYLSQSFRNIVDNPRHLWSNKTDSMVTLYPNILLPTYYQYLFEKAKTSDNDRLQFTSKRLPISRKTYFRLIDKINKSGYWTLPTSISCGDKAYADGVGILLEANTPTRFNVVRLSNCFEDALEFSNACQALVDASGFETKIHLVTD